MKNDLTEKLLNEQTTPDEERQIAKMLRQDEDMEQWLTEDETAEYDRIVSQRRTRRRTLRWAIAAAVLLLMAAGAFVLWPRLHVSDVIAEQKTKELPAPVIPEVLPSAAVTMPAKPVAHAHRTQRHARKQPAANTTDSLQYYIARLEEELDHIADSSTYTAKAEQIIRADARLQRLVQRIMIGETEKNNQPIEALITNEMKEEQP